MVSSFSLQNTPTLQARLCRLDFADSVFSSSCHPKNGELNKKEKEKNRGTDYQIILLDVF